ncbi:MAG: Asp23/Gls24 family envelope stress response protein, partial [Lactobacillus iners]|nr:Asp23/Gls24 family envelope stress response protein [Lactobacillus iners]
MPESSTILLSNNENGDETRVDLGVLEVILGIAAKKVDGVNEMRGSLKSSIDKIFGRSNQGKGVSLTNRNG